MSDNTIIKFIQGLIDTNNALTERIEKLEQQAALVQELDHPAPALRRWVSTDN